MNTNTENTADNTLGTAGLVEQHNKSLSFTLHSSYTVLKRMIHIVCIISVLYGIRFASIQFTELQSLNAVQHSAFGTNNNGYDAAKQHATFFAALWSSPSFQDPVEQNALIALWLSLESVKFVAVYSETGHLVNLAPAGSSLKEVISRTHNPLTVTSLFKSQQNTGQVILVVDNAAVTKLQTQREVHLFKGLLACIVIAAIGGAYLFRSFRYIRPKNRS